MNTKQRLMIYFAALVLSTQSKGNLYSQTQENQQIDTKLNTTEALKQSIVKKTDYIEYQDGFNRGDDTTKTIVRDYYGNGQLKSETVYKNNVLNGIYKIYYENGQKKYEMPYIKGKVEGVVRSYYKNGQLESEILFKNNMINGLLIYYYENGHKKSETSYKNNLMDGLCIIYYDEDSNKVLSETQYLNGKKEGLEKAYYGNGLLIYEIPYINDRMEGEARFYGKNKIRRVYYINGEQVKKREWEIFEKYVKAKENNNRIQNTNSITR